MSALVCGGGGGGSRVSFRVGSRVFGVASRVFSAGSRVFVGDSPLLGVWLACAWWGLSGVLW